MLLCVMQPALQSLTRFQPRNLAGGRFFRPPLPQKGFVMRVKILDKCYTGTIGNMFAGSEYDVHDRIAEKLIARGLAEEVKPARAKKKLTDRSVSSDEIETPEDE
jgi:hypothetical protein